MNLLWASSERTYDQGKIDFLVRFSFANASRCKLKFSNYSGFHSCVGGCFGCLNLDDGSNAGLKDGFESLESFFVDHELSRKGISRADFWALAAVLAVKAGYKKNLKKYRGQFQSAKKTVKLCSFFELLGSARLKAACRSLVKLTPGLPCYSRGLRSLEISNCEYQNLFFKPNLV